MKTSVIEVHDMLSVLTVDEVEKRIGEVPGVESATVNYAARNATVRYDETRLEVADIKVIVHQRGHQPAGESLPIEESEREPARKPAAEPTPTVAPASALKPEAATPKTSTVATVARPATTGPGEDGQEDKTASITQPAAPEPAVPKAAPAAMAAPISRAGDGQQDKATPSAPPSATAAAPPKPSPVTPTAKPSTPLAAAPKVAPDANSPTPAAAESKPDAWKVHALSLTVTLSVAYSLCAIFDVLFPRFGLLAALAPASPLPLSGSPLAYLTGFALFTVAGFVFGALHGIAWEFWSKRLR
jgi:Cu2+-exporting ATPase